MLGGKPKVLMIDDELSVLETYGTKLSRSGYQVVTAISGHETVCLAKKHWPDLIILDIIMPMVDGYRVLAKLKSDAVTKSIPVLILSQEQGQDRIDKGIQTGADHYLVKANYTPAELVERVDYIMSQKILAYRYKNFNR